MNDVDGDGQADLVAIDANGVNGALSDGTGVKDAIVAFAGLNPNDGWTSQNATPRFLEDANGDEKGGSCGFWPLGRAGLPGAIKGAAPIVQCIQIHSRRGRRWVDSSLLPCSHLQQQGFV